jgi:hypothetical protein
MATAKKTTKTRRQVSKARLLKELLSTMEAYDMGTDKPVGVLLDAIRNDIVEEQMAK